jgi:hypothetical protein
LIAPKIQAVLDEALRDDGVIDVDAAPLSISSTTKSRSIRKEKDKEKHSKTSKTRWVSFSTLECSINITVHKYCTLRFEVSTPMIVKIVVIWIATSCSLLVDSYQHFV